MAVDTQDNLSIEAWRAGADVLIVLTGELTFPHCDEFYACIKKLSDGADEQIYIDLGSLRFADSVGMGTMVRVYGRARSKGKQMSLLRPGDTVFSLLRLIKAERIMDIVHANEAAPIVERLKLDENAVEL